VFAILIGLNDVMPDSHTITMPACFYLFDWALLFGILKSLLVEGMLAIATLISWWPDKNGIGQNGTDKMVRTKW